jgi:polyisoprenoid-binding protein YceI
VPPGRYVLDERTSRVRFRVRKLGLLPVEGTFTGAGGTLDVPGGPAGTRVVAAVPAATFRTGNRRRDEHVVGPAFLDAAHHPVLRFTGEAAPSAGDGGWAVPGILTVRGSSRPVTFTVESLQWLPAPGRVRLAAGATVRRSDFGIVAYRWLAADVVTVLVEAEASPS